MTNGYEEGQGCGADHRNATVPRVQLGSLGKENSRAVIKTLNVCYNRLQAGTGRQWIT